MTDVLALRDLPAPDHALPSFVPPPRFGTTTFGTYEPQHASQQKALERTRAFVKETHESGRWFWQKPPRGKGLYLDGGFGVGKTHLLAAAYAAYPGKEKMYCSFSELVHVTGVLGGAKAKAELGHAELYCIDEFELDDPGNTLIIKAFLAYVFERGGKVITTSNTPSEAQGQGRFNANDFKREIQSIAERFEMVPLKGPDYRKREKTATLLSQAELETLQETEPVADKVHATWTELFKVLTDTHPVRYEGLLEPIGTLYAEGAQPITDQNDALRFVHFIDKLYNLKVGLRLSGEIALEELFDPSYADGAYAKKHYRCLSRISELLEEGRQPSDSAASRAASSSPEPRRA